MNLFQELERLTDPGVLRKVKVYSADEIKGMQARGEITPIEQVHKASCLPRVSVPDTSCRGAYDR